MTLEELKAFEAAHPEYAPLFGQIMKEFDKLVKEEFGKAFRAIDERAKACKEEHVAKYNVPEEDAKVLAEAMLAFSKQVNEDFKKNVRGFFEKHRP